MPHPLEHDVPERLAPEEAAELAEAMRAFGAASRLLLLWGLLEGERTVEQLVALTHIRASAASQQLRLLRQARLVTVRREGRHAYYRLHDHHVADLLVAIRSHYDHLQLPDDRPAAAGADGDAAEAGAPAEPVARSKRP